MLAALRGNSVVGLLRFVEQHIGPDNDQPPVRLGATPLVEAKVLAFVRGEDKAGAYFIMPLTPGDRRS